MALSDYDGFRARQEAARAAGRYIGIGIGNYVEGTGLGPFEGVTVRILPSGKVAVATGATTQGQGTHTTLSQIVADRLGCPIADIVVTARRHQRDQPGRRRLRQPAGHQCRQLGDDRGRQREGAGRRAGGAHPRALRRPRSTSRTAAPSPAAATSRS